MLCHEDFPFALVSVPPSFKLADLGCALVQAWVQAFGGLQPLLTPW